MIDRAAFDRVVATIPPEMERLGVPGVALGVLHGGGTLSQGLGVTSVEHQQPIEPSTLFRIASITKTFTATATMRLVEQGKLDLDAPLQRYLPGLRLADRDASERATLRHCLNHHGGWTGDVFEDFGRGDDALTRIVAHMAEVPQLTPIGEVFSYNNVGFCLAGRAIEVVTGQTFEAAVQTLLLDPLEMRRTFFFADDALTHRVAVGHVALPNGPWVTRPWSIPRASHAAGGLISCVDDLLIWARFHLGDGQGLLSRATLDHMQAALHPAGSLATSVGVAFLTNFLGEQAHVGHGGSWRGQMSAMRLVPARAFAVIVLTNGHRGGELHGRTANAAMREHLGSVPIDRPHVTRPEAQLRACVGTYVAVLDDVAIELRAGALVVTQVRRDTLGAEPPPPVPAPTRLAFVSDDEVIGLDDPSVGARGEFLRAADGSVAWFRWGGRIHRRMP